MNERNPRKKAVALKYDGHGAPTVVAKGQALIAEEIIRLAREANVPIVDQPELVELLAQVELDQEIPPMLYQAVVEVLIFAYELSGKVPPQPKK
ncbi:EscU/YscU/HrcU family type III secretion system export apparatus switch protein [Sulfurivirga sp.]|uniref:EscU/YscU/HrcU family type III secretion system export apparatus switch protein n=1 Tax=Sulfurivirga sp. TaxID=2614236 RepID=UPI0025DD58F6|nr:EscU/YscU/HrcU family type III secretion system export apparatus switch protein [Sulfurivirga sp.]